VEEIMTTLLGVLFIVLGFLAIVEPLVAGLAVALLAGWALLAGGVVHVISAFRGAGARTVAWHIVLAVLYLLGGVYFVTHPLLGLGTLTLFLALILLVEGGVWIAAYFQTRSERGSVWMLLNGVITLVLGLMIWAGWPSSSVWAIGTLIGVNLLMTGMSLIFVGSAVRRLAA
jgi:uncharacterized membrane protein HdeD (DUF308 family)